ncbi:MAG: FHA domain-containing protein [Eubacteriales bacterium]|nr:FHA domain-containing protein [Eubacteriales bacterium]
MNLVQCEAGHFYDGDKYASCPHCARTGQEAGETVPVDKAAEGTMIKCGKGHYYDSAKFSSCPYCEQEGKEYEETVPLETKKETTLADLVNSGKRTVFADEDKTISLSMTKKGTEPVVGWLVCIKGESEGKSYPLKANKNFIGRASVSDVVIEGDTSVSREKHAVIIYESHARIFIAQPGESRELYYLNGKVVLNNETLKAYDILEIGGTKLLFMPLCGEKFSWEDVGKEEKEGE